MPTYSKQKVTNILPKYSAKKHFYRARYFTVRQPVRKFLCAHKIYLNCIFIMYSFISIIKNCLQKINFKVASAGSVILLISHHCHHRRHCHHPDHHCHRHDHHLCRLYHHGRHHRHRLPAQLLSVVQPLLF